MNISRFLTCGAVLVTFAGSARVSPNTIDGARRRDPSLV